MDLSAPETSLVLFWTVTRVICVAVVATEAWFLLRRARSTTAEAGTTSRLVWSATPALLLAGLSLWCLAALPAPRGMPSATSNAFASSTPSQR